ncbi:MAG: bifunctional molybdenum cofactor biosynthesis protein MoaC/MoaB [Chitinophagaceae bacterium]|nr:MAG: bifunctional molybdenum cofactor biosynthesis protein MoaC/MoaB [Chitinophagaceae bacterium]
MVDITHKNNTLRKAIAVAILKVSEPRTIDLINARQIPKGDVFEFSRAAGLLAVKKTSDVIPDCHPLPVEYTAIRHSIEGLEIRIEVEVHTIYKTGVEVEAMHGATITALTMYDMLKPVDKSVEIGSVKLLSKEGGKSSFNSASVARIKCAVIVCSDTVSAGKQEDRSGKTIIEKLESYGSDVSRYEVIPDDPETIRSVLLDLKTKEFRMAIFSGGTGVSPRDNTPDVIAPLLDREVPGIMEAARNYGQSRMPYAMLSRGIAGFSGDLFVLTLPGSVGGVTESMNALFPHIFHIFRVAEGHRHP